MEQLLFDELQLILLLVQDRPTLLNFINESKLEYISYSSKKYLFFQHSEIQRIWIRVVNAVAENLDVQNEIENEIKSWEWHSDDKDKVINYIHHISTLNINPFVLEVLYRKFKRNTELKIANYLIQSFQENMNLGHLSLQEACDLFFMECPRTITSDYQKVLVGQNCQVYWNSERVFENLYELEQELRNCKEHQNIRWVLNCAIENKELLENEDAQERLKEIMRNLGVEILHVNLK